MFLPEMQLSNFDLDLSLYVTVYDVDNCGMLLTVCPCAWPFTVLKRYMRNHVVFSVYISLIILV